MCLRAFIFDLDGVLTDTAHYHYLAWKQLADDLGYEFDEKINERLKGVSRVRSFEIILEVNDALDEYSAEEIERHSNLKNDQYVKLIDDITPDDILPGIIEFLEEARGNGIKLAVASASKNAGKVLSLLGISDQFDYVADAASIANPKPAPDIFLDCGEALGCAPIECIGFEDAQAGVEAIDSAGIFSVGINVAVTSVAPSIELKSTDDLNLKFITDRYELWVACREPSLSIRALSDNDHHEENENA